MELGAAESQPADVRQPFTHEFLSQISPMLAFHEFLSMVAK